MIKLYTPISEERAANLKVGDMVLLSGDIICGRDAVLPKIVKMAQEGELETSGIDLRGGVIFHTAVSQAGVGPTSSNKLEIESSFQPLSSLAGVKMHLGKGAISPVTASALNENNAVYAIMPPVTALLESKTLSREVVAYPELGMEALFRVKVNGYPAIIAVANGVSIYDR